MTRQPIGLHAVTHMLQGSDPITGLREISWAYLSHYPVPGTAIPNGLVLTFLDIQDGVSGVFDTNDPTVFENGVHTYSGTPYHGLGILVPGTYMFIVDGVWTGGLSAAGRGDVFYAWIDLGPGGGGTSESNFQFGRASVLGSDTWDANRNLPHLSFIEIFNIPGDGEGYDGFPSTNSAPTQWTMYAQQSGTTTAHVQVGLVVLRLGPEFKAGIID